MPRGNSVLRSTMYLAATCIALGALWAGVKGGLAVAPFGALAGAATFGATAGAGFLVAFLAAGG
jgi:hypothetical protein